MAIGNSKPSPLHFTFLILILLTTPSPSSSSSFIIPIPSSFNTMFYLSHSLLTRVANLRAARGDISGAVRVRTLANKIDVGLEIFELVSDINELMKFLTELSRLESRVDRVEWVRRNYGSLLEIFELVSDINELMKCLTELSRLESRVDRIEWVRRNYGSLLEIFELVSDSNELIKCLTELSRLESRVDWVECIRRNYGSLLKSSVSLLRLLQVFPHSVDKYMKVIRYHLEFIQEIQNIKGVLQMQDPLKEALEMVRTEIVDGGLLEDCLELGSSDLKGVIQILIDVALHYTSNGKSEL